MYSNDVEHGLEYARNLNNDEKFTLFENGKVIKEFNEKEVENI